jgi:hypothetical protein
MRSRPTTVDSSQRAAGPGPLTPPASARHTLLTRPKRDNITAPTRVHVTVDGDRDHLGDPPEGTAGLEDTARPAATRTRKRWPFVLPPGWTRLSSSHPAEPGQSPLMTNVRHEELRKCGPAGGGRQARAIMGLCWPQHDAASAVRARRFPERGSRVPRLTRAGPGTAVPAGGLGDETCPISAA